jgi:hypothetical protein
VFSTYGWSAGAGYTSMRVGNLTAYGAVYATGEVTAYSDAKLKINVETVSDALDKVLKLRGVTYDRKDAETPKRLLGVIAQEVREILPEVVSESTDMHGETTLSVSYGNITALLIEAVKTLSAEIEELKKKLQ